MKHARNNYAPIKSAYNNTNIFVGLKRISNPCLHIKLSKTQCTNNALMKNVCSNTAYNHLLLIIINKIKGQLP